ncbi:hypothetical protein DUNSADRAFT_4743 [Dunaliella salina]|uniref:adenylate kinase n=1 Tax=Dunaliella salina TaxID=3046 RepID=A0ABQ7GRF0_DUNSA|nr:hypothetical protein DUNSADRAFT_4743 [Dunaliella salina]|eukprot:KAF5837183.1 hypothetical protein DUNSADRAFT_4743 [Dunaliella salina]
MLSSINFRQQCPSFPAHHSPFPHTFGSHRSLHSGGGVLCQPAAGNQGPFEEQQDNNSVVPPDKKKASSSKASDATDIRMESQCIFDACWRRFEDKYKLKNVRVPREVVFLNGAPGSGKGANTVHILKTRGLETSISLSSLLISHPEARAIIEKGEMIPDMLVGDILLEALLANSCKSTDCGVLVDGFPRTAVQVVVLYVDMETSIKRQKERAKLASLHNERVMDAGAGQLWEQRATDVSVEKCKRRYEIFKQHYSATMRLKQFFPFHLIDSMGTLEETQEAISLELRYQSSLDLSEATYAAIRHLPLSRDLAQHARQQLVSRLDDHCQKCPDLFHQVIDVITTEIMPVLRESGMAGRVEYVSQLPLFTDNPRAAMMLIDVLTDRGFSVSHTADVLHVPESVDLNTGAIKNRKETKHRFHIHWDTKGVREMAKAIEIATRMAESAAKDSAQISQSFIPSQPSVPAKYGEPWAIRQSSPPSAATPQGQQPPGESQGPVPPPMPAQLPGHDSSSSGSRGVGSAHSQSSSVGDHNRGRRDLYAEDIAAHGTSAHGS